MTLAYSTCTLEDVVEGVNDWLLDVRAIAETRANGIEDEEERQGEISEVEELFQDYTIAEAEAMLAVIQSLDPAGVGARDLRECILLQLRIRGEEETLAFQLVRNHFEDFLNHKWNENRPKPRAYTSCGTGCRRRGRQARSKTRTTVRSGRGCLHSPRSHRREDRRGVSRFPERYESASASTLAVIPRGRAGQRQIQRRKQGLHRLEAQFGQLDDPGDRAAASDDAEGHEFHRRPSA